MTKNSKPANDPDQKTYDPNNPVHVAAVEEQRRLAAEAEQGGAIAAAPRSITIADAPARMPFGVIKECSNCDGFHRAPAPNQERGLCQRHPPTPLCTGMQSGPVGPVPVISSYYPVVGEHSKCSDWVAKDETAAVDFSTLGAKQ
jgi:hypothetical protein